MKRLLCIRFPNWPLQRLLVARPELDGRPLLLQYRDERRGECVAVCSKEAAACGARAGQPLAEATALSSRGPAFLVLPYDPVADRRALQRLAEDCERFSPLVGWEAEIAQAAPTARSARRSSQAGTLPESQPDHLLLDVTGIGPLFGGEAALLQGVKAELARHGYTAWCAIAGTIGAAWAFASYAAAEPAGRAGVIWDGATDWAAALGPLPIAALRVPPDNVELLAQLGIVRIGQLLALPRSSLASRFGERLLLRVDQACGTAPEMIVAHRHPPRYEAEWLLEDPTDHRETMEQIVTQLLDRVTRELQPRHEGVVQFACRFDCAGGPPLQLVVGLFRPSSSARHLWELMRLQWEQLRLPGPVGRVSVHVLLAAPHERRQLELFGETHDAREAAQQRTLLIDRLSSRLGPNSVVRPQVCADALPERAYRYVPLTGHVPPRKTSASRRRAPRSTAAPDPDTNASASVSAWAADQRPLRLLRAPCPLPTIVVASHGAPLSFEFRGEVQRVVRHWGPERIETGWWRGRTARRDYYRVETTTGSRLWLFRRLDNGTWHLHGVFE